VAWNIHQYPTIYVLDPQGVIRYKNVFGKDLERAVSTLLAEMQAANGAGRQDRQSAEPGGPGQTP
jgi:hypothetical protein